LASVRVGLDAAWWRRGVGVVGGLAAAVVVAAGPATALQPGPPSVLNVGQIARQDVPVLPGSEPDTLVEPDVAVSPLDPDLAVAVAHDGRYPDGGAVGIEHAWTDNGGATWHHAPLPGVTVTTGGEAAWARASDPVAAYGPDGTAYVSTLVFDVGCNSGVVVSRSTDGGKTFANPVVAHRSATCDISDDKNWLVVDTSPTSPHRGRLYQFWTPFLTDLFGNPDGSPQALVWSDDGGATWSAPVSVSPPHANTQNSQPMIRPDGTLVDAYLDYGPNGSAEGPEAAEARAGANRTAPAARTASPKAGADATYPVFTTATSADGGATWKHGGAITRDLGDGPPGFRCCLPSATADPVTGTLYAAWNSANPARVKLSQSRDGKTWSSPVVVNRPTPSLLGVNVDVSAYAGTVSVSYGLTNTDTSSGRFGRQFVSTSRDGGNTFLAPTAVGPQINYAYAAVARGIFPGDYIGSAMTKGRLYAVWAVSSTPPNPNARYHQVLYGASFDTTRSPVSSSIPEEQSLVLRP
jgi:hypothetical protein